MNTNQYRAYKVDAEFVEADRSRRLIWQTYIHAFDEQEALRDAKHQFLVYGWCGGTLEWSVKEQSTGGLSRTERLEAIIAAQGELIDKVAYRMDFGRSCRECGSGIDTEHYVDCTIGQRIAEIDRMIEEAK